MDCGILLTILFPVREPKSAITNNIGIEGIPTQEGIEYLHAETIEEYIRNIIKVFEDPEFAKKIGEAGRNFIKSNYDLNMSSNKYKERILKDIIEG